MSPYTWETHFKRISLPLTISWLLSAAIDRSLVRSPYFHSRCFRIPGQIENRRHDKKRCVVTLKRENNKRFCLFVLIILQPCTASDNPYSPAFMRIEAMRTALIGAVGLALCPNWAYSLIPRGLLAKIRHENLEEIILARCCVMMTRSGFEHPPKEAVSWMLPCIMGRLHAIWRGDLKRDQLMRGSDEGSRDCKKTNKIGFGGFFNDCWSLKHQSRCHSVHWLILNRRSTDGVIKERRASFAASFAPWLISGFLIESRYFKANKSRLMDVLKNEKDNDCLLWESLLSWLISLVFLWSGLNIWYTSKAREKAWRVGCLRNIWYHMIRFDISSLDYVNNKCS